MKQPLVTVGVASVNNAEYIIETLDSVKNQTYKNIELIIVDDCSSDNSVDIINRWIERNNGFNVKLVKNSVNYGICKTFNNALSQSNGIYISILGSDDNLLPDKIYKQVDLFNNLSSDYGYIYTDTYKIKKNGDRWFGNFIQTHRQFMKIPQGDIFSDLILGNYIPIMSVLWRKECFEQCGLFDENLIYEDYDMLLRVSRKYKCCFLDYVSAEYRIHGNNITNKRRSIHWMESDFIIFYKHLGYSKETDEIIKGKLGKILIEISSIDKFKLKKYYDMYYVYFKDFTAMNISLKTGINYKKIIKIFYTVNLWFGK